MNPLVSKVKKLGAISENMYLDDVFNTIRNGDVKVTIEKLRRLKSEEKVDEAANFIINKRKILS